MNKEILKARLEEYIEYLLAHSDYQNPMWNIEKIRSGSENKWNYIDACMIQAILSLYELTGKEKYLTFADDFMSGFVKEDGSIRTYEVEEYNIDNVNPAKNLFKLYDYTGKEKYRKAMDTVYRQIKEMPRTESGNFWHKKIYPNQVWLDGLYMAQPFYMEYEKRYNKMRFCGDSFRQFQNVEKSMKDEVTGLYYHGYDESRQMYWADKISGCSKNFWLRALGWFTLALVDTALAIDESQYFEYRYLQRMLKDLIDSILKYQDESGMFYQVIDKAKAEGNYLETSGTALISYAILKAVRCGLLPKRYYAFGEKAFYGIAEKYLQINQKGEISLGGICLVAGLGGKERRDGSLAYYLSEPVVENEAKGVAPFLLAFTEVLRGEENGVSNCRDI